MQADLYLENRPSRPYYVSKSRLSLRKLTPPASHPPSMTYHQRSTIEEARGGRPTLPLRSADPSVPPVSLSLDMDLPLILKINIHHASKLVWIEGSR